MQNDIFRFLKSPLLLIILFVIEYLCLIFHTYTPAVSILSIGHFIAGILIVFVGFSYSTRPALDSYQKLEARSLWWGIVLLTFLIFQHFLERSFDAEPMDYRRADMLPVIKIMCERFLNGQDSYTIIYEIWDGTKPIYLPAMWMPFLPAIIFDFDMRWVPSCLFLIGLLSVSAPLLGEKRLSANFVLIIAISALLIFSITLYKELFTLTEEGLIIGYYLLLAAALRSKNAWYIGIMIGCCLMSRYSLAFWTVLVTWVYWRKKEYYEIVKIIFASVLMCIIWMTAGRAWPYVETFLSLPSHYVTEMLKNEAKYIPEIQRNLGLAKFFTFEQLPLINRISIITAILTPLACCIFFDPKKHIHSALYLIIALKASLVLFYNLLVLPYSYLFFVSVFLTYALMVLVTVNRSNGNLHI